MAMITGKLETDKKKKKHEKKIVAKCIASD